MRWPRINVAYCTALFVLAFAILLGSAQNIVFMASLGASDATRSVWIGLAVLAAILKFRIPLTEGWYKSLPLLAGFCCAVLFDLLCAIGHGAITRGHKLDAYEAKVAAHSKQQAEVSRIERELAGVAVRRAPAITSAALAAELDAERAKYGCRGESETKGRCAIRLADLKGQLAQVQRGELDANRSRATHDELAAELKVARERLAAAMVPTHPDPQAAELARRLGWSERVTAGWQTWLGMALLELGVLAGALMAEKARTAPVGHVRAPYEPIAPKAPERERKSSGAGPAAALDVLERLATGQLVAAGVTVTGRTIAGSQTALALACGCSQPTIGRWLGELQVSGKVTLAKQGRQTVVVLT